MPLFPVGWLQGWCGSLCFIATRLVPHVKEAIHTFWTQSHDSINWCIDIEHLWAMTCIRLMITKMDMLNIFQIPSCQHISYQLYRVPYHVSGTPSASSHLSNHDVQLHHESACLLSSSKVRSLKLTDVIKQTNKCLLHLSHRLYPSVLPITWFIKCKSDQQGGG